MPYASFGASGDLQKGFLSVTSGHKVNYEYLSHWRTCQGSGNPQSQRYFNKLSWKAYYTARKTHSTVCSGLSSCLCAQRIAGSMIMNSNVNPSSSAPQIKQTQEVYMNSIKHLPGGLKKNPPLKHLCKRLWKNAHTVLLMISLMMSLSAAPMYWNMKIRPGNSNWLASQNRRDAKFGSEGQLPNLEAFSLALAFKCYNFTFLNDLLDEVVCNLFRYSFHLLKTSYITFAFLIFLEIIFEFQKNIKNSNENVVINTQGHIFSLEIIITHISYSHHFITFILFFYVMIVLRLSIKALIVKKYTRNHSESIGSINPDNPDHGSFTKPTQLSQPIKISEEEIKPWFGTHTRAWKANQISSEIQFSLFPLQKMSHSCFHSPPSLSLNLPRLIKLTCLQLLPCNHNVQLQYKITKCFT
ncbi:hypothetical protein VP01_2427g1 [Puccinia sorghi]|uniref:Uncharacterized protein n=1 Tax=Puccinia sorghi TaxID=27349 RepID=A0A0L6V6I2_9BASI|nr:hypothetical protein VP01_2427g1 [Puccinia sorghi]